MSVLGTYYFGYKMPDYCEFGGEPNPDTSVGVHVASTASSDHVWLEVIRWNAGEEDRMEREECGAAFDLETAELIAAALTRWIAAHKKAA